ncbi:MAG: hypothetical protein AB7P02_05145 [Alphaproteobacteria bacterium]
MRPEYRNVFRKPTLYGGSGLVIGEAFATELASLSDARNPPAGATYHQTFERADNVLTLFVWDMTEPPPGERAARVAA